MNDTCANHEKPYDVMTMSRESNMMHPVLHTKNAVRPLAPWMELLSEQIQSIFLCPLFFVRYLSRK